MQSRPWFAELIAYNRAVLAQGIALTQQFAGQREDFGERVGPHLRHVIEHYEALLTAPEARLVDYDHRPRDRSVETDPALAAQRLSALIATLEPLQATRQAGEALTVGFRVGLDGSEFSLIPSTLARELHFVASHAIHHYALIRTALLDLRIAVPEHFGKAPDTVRFERLRFST